MTSRPLWSMDAMTAAMQARAEGPLPASATGISIDSRTLTPGEAFFAIEGENRDGHAFVPSALERGAAVAVVTDSKRDEMPAGAPLLIVADVLQGLRELARAARARSPANVIGVTGSVGKTSSKEALRLALTPEGETYASAASYNNHWGVPLSLARCAESARFAIFELGMNHAGEISPLTRLVRPHVAIITTIEPVHLEFFRSIDDIADAKAEIFEGVESDGAAVINRDIPQYERLAARARASGIKQLVAFGEHVDARARLIKYTLHPDCSVIEARILGTDVAYKLGAPGRHLVMNSLAVLAAAALAGADLARAGLALSELRPAIGRGSRISLDLPGGPALLIDESYNANPASMRAALALLGQAPVDRRGRRIAVLGDMLELGPADGDLHRGLADAINDH